MAQIFPKWTNEIPRLAPPVLTLAGALAIFVVWFSRWWENFADRTVVDGLVNGFAAKCYSFGLGLRTVQTGRIRQYVLFIVLGAIAVFVLISFFGNPAAAVGLNIGTK